MVCLLRREFRTKKERLPHRFLRAAPEIVMARILQANIWATAPL